MYLIYVIKRLLIFLEYKKPWQIILWNGRMKVWNHFHSTNSFWTLNQFSHSVMSDSLQPHELQHARPPCPSPTPGVHPNPCPSSQWCHPAISSSVVPFSSCPQSFTASGSFPMSQLFTSGSWVVGAEMKIHKSDWESALRVRGVVKSRVGRE